MKSTNIKQEFHIFALPACQGDKRMKVKICGITDIETARAAARSGADAIGFVFAESKRKINSRKSKRNVSQIPKDLLKVGVFVNEEKEEIEEIAMQVGLTHIQLHGDETR